MRFNVKIKLPSGKERRVQELSNKDYLTIIKFAENKDYEGLNLFFEDIILDPDLNIFDRLYILIYIRMLFVDDMLVISNNERQIDVSLVTLLNTLESNYKDLETVFEENGIKVVLDLPSLSFFNKIDELLIGSIKSVTLGNKTLNFYELSKEEQSDILDNLPSSIFHNTKQFIKTISTDLLNVTIVDENKSLGVERLDIDVIGNGVIQFISNIFSTDLDQFYNMMYIFLNTVTPGSDRFFKMSPVESRILMNHHNKKIKEENDRLAKQQRENN
jgi:hypothetical protein